MHLFHKLRVPARLLMAWLLGACTSATGQVISGRITDPKGDGLPGINVYLKNTLDGTTTGAGGNFSFRTEERGAHTLVASGIGYQTAERGIQLAGKPVSLVLELAPAEARLPEVVVTAGRFEASGSRPVAILRPMDIYTTAGATGDIAGAIQTLPGTQRVGEQTGLFVRGGDASETVVVIDGQVAQNAFRSQIPGVAQRSRFSPFQFAGIAFSSGGYSVRYGQALSSVLELTTTDLPAQSSLSAGVSMGGVQLGGAKRLKNAALEANAGYTNLKPFYRLARTNFPFYRTPRGGNGSVRGTARIGERGLLKAFGKYDYYTNGMVIPHPEAPGETTRYGLTNRNVYTSASYQHTGEKTHYFAAFSYSHNQDEIRWEASPARNRDHRGQGRVEARHFVSDAWNVLMGVEGNAFAYRRRSDSLSGQFRESQVAVYLEPEWKSTGGVAVKPGLRYEYSGLLKAHTLAPRLALAFRTGSYSQISVAGGLFYQNPDGKYLLAGYRPGSQSAVHYLANYQWIKNDRYFRLEGYYKTYHHLVREPGAVYTANPYRVPAGPPDNGGSGYARGVDLFFRDKASFKNLDCWVAYSLLDSERQYENFPARAAPDFASRHNLNLTIKYFLPAVQLSAGLTYSYASGRPYYNPSAGRFMGDRTPAYHNLALTAHYLTRIWNVFTVVYLGVDNLTNHRNIFGYRYAADGHRRFPVEPALYRFLFVGVNFSLTAFNQDEL